MEVVDLEISLGTVECDVVRRPGGGFCGRRHCRHYADRREAVFTDADTRGRRHAVGGVLPVLGQTYTRGFRA